MNDFFHRAVFFIYEKKQVAWQIGWKRLLGLFLQKFDPFPLHTLCSDLDDAISYIHVRYVQRHLQHCLCPKAAFLLRSRVSHGKTLQRKLRLYLSRESCALVRLQAKEARPRTRLYDAVTISIHVLLPCRTFYITLPLSFLITFSPDLLT